MTALANRWIGHSTLLLYFSEFNHFLEIAVIYVCVLLCKSKVFLKIVAVTVRIEQDGNCS